MIEPYVPSVGELIELVDVHPDFKDRVEEPGARCTASRRFARAGEWVENGYGMLMRVLPVAPYSNKQPDKLPETLPAGTRLEVSGVVVVVAENCCPLQAIGPRTFRYGAMVMPVNQHDSHAIADHITFDAACVDWQSYRAAVVQQARAGAVKVAGLSEEFKDPSKCSEVTSPTAAATFCVSCHARATLSDTGRCVYCHYRVAPVRPLAPPKRDMHPAHWPSVDSGANWED